MSLLSAFDMALAKLANHEHSGEREVSGNGKMLEQCYPAMPPPELLSSIVSKQRGWSTERQISWWNTLARKLTDSVIGDPEWRCRVYQMLSDEYDRQKE